MSVGGSPQWLGIGPYFVVLLYGPSPLVGSAGVVVVDFSWLDYDSWRVGKVVGGKVG